MTAAGAKRGTVHYGIVTAVRSSIVVAPSRHSGSAIERYLICDSTDTHPYRRSNGTPGDKANASRSYWWNEPLRTTGNANYIDSESFTRLWSPPNFRPPAGPREGEAKGGGAKTAIFSPSTGLSATEQENALRLRWFPTLSAKPPRERRPVRGDPGSGKDGARRVCFRTEGLIQRAVEFWGRTSSSAALATGRGTKHWARQATESFSRLRSL